MAGNAVASVPWEAMATTVSAEVGEGDDRPPTDSAMMEAIKKLSDASRSPRPAVSLSVAICPAFEYEEAEAEAGTSAGKSWRALDIELAGDSCQ